MKIRADYIAIILYIGIMVCAALYGMYMAYYQTTPTSEWTTAYFEKVDKLIAVAGVPVVGILLYYNKKDKKDKKDEEGE